MSALPKPYYTPQKYLALERKSTFKIEYWNGEIFVMAGASERHNLIRLNVGFELRTQLRGRNCRVYASDMRIRISATGLYTYPDVVVVCGKPQFEDNQNDSLLNPALIVKVLSKSTESYDRGKKFQNYRTLTSLAEYILIVQNAYQLEHYIRPSNDQWLLSETRGLGGISCYLPSTAPSLLPKFMTKSKSNR